MEIKYVDPKILIPYAKNAKKHPREQVAAVAESIKEFGMVQPIVADINNEVVIGHCRLMACKKLKYKAVPVLYTTELTDQQVKGLRLADNKTNESEWLDDLLGESLSEILDFDMALFGFSLDDLDDDADVIEDEVPDVENETTAKLGDVWQLGRHKVLCGDSTDSPLVAEFMEEQQADLIVTDPPYNVDYQGSNGLKIENDNMDNDSFRQFLVDAFRAINENLKPGGAFYIWHADSEGHNFRGACFDIGWRIRQCLIWNKNAMVMGRQDYHWKHEPCLYGWKDGAGHYFTDDRTQTTVFEDGTPDFKKMTKAQIIEFCKEAFSDKVSTTIINEDRPARSEDHPTMKPIKLLARLIKNSSRPGELVVDTFGGSGSTLITCEQLNRTCYTVELDPRYVDVIIKRWEAFTGQIAVKIN